MAASATGEKAAASARADLLACLVLVGRSHGLAFTVDQLVRDNVLGDALPDVSGLLTCARRAGFRASAIPLDGPGCLTLGQALPAIVLFGDGSAGVLDAAEGGRVNPVLRLRDPAEPDLPFVLSGAAVAEAGIVGAVLLRPAEREAESEQSFGFGMIGALMMADRRLVTDIAISAVGMSVLALTPVVFWTLLGSQVLASHARDTFAFLCVGAAVLIAFEAAFSALRRQALVSLSARVDQRLSAWMFDRLLTLPIEVFETTPVGSVTRTIAQMSKVRSFLAGQMFGALLDAVVLVVFLPVMAFTSGLLTGVVLVLVGLMVGWLAVMLPPHRRRTDAVETAETERGALLSETVQGIRTVRTLALDRRQIERWNALTTRIEALRTAESRQRNMIQTVIAPLERLSLSGTIAVGAAAAIVHPGTIGIGTLLTFIMLTQRVASPLLQMSQLLQQYGEARAAIDQVADLLNQPSEGGRDGRGVRSPVVGAVSFSGVRFRYRGAPGPALRDVTFALPAGSTFGIMGRSGSGKTTVTRLLQRLHSDYAGTVRVDGVEVREYAVDHLRASLGVVLQENFLFAGSIRDNIAAAKSDASPEEVVRAARLAGAEEFIDKLPRGYETPIYEGSPNLSGGQRQRIAIARALITDPRILILDEATSALDAESEAIVNSNLKRIAAGRTTIVVSHRLSSLVGCDAIMVLEAGEVADIGTHAELLERSDIYAGLWARQTAHAAPNAPLSTDSLPKLTRGAHG